MDKAPVAKGEKGKGDKTEGELPKVKNGGETGGEKKGGDETGAVEKGGRNTGDETGGGKNGVLPVVSGKVKDMQFSSASHFWPAGSDHSTNPK